MILLHSNAKQCVNVEMHRDGDRRAMREQLSPEAGCNRNWIYISTDRLREILQLVVFTASTFISRRPPLSEERLLTRRESHLRNKCH